MHCPCQCQISAPYIWTLVRTILCLSLALIKLLLLLLLLLLFVITFMKGIYNYMPKANHVSRVYNVEAIL